MTTIRANSIKQWWIGKRLLAQLEAECKVRIRRGDDALLLAYMKGRDGYGVRNKNFKRQHQQMKEAIELHEGRPMMPREEIALFIKNVVRAKRA